MAPQTNRHLLRGVANAIYGYGLTNGGFEDPSGSVLAKNQTSKNQEVLGMILRDGIVASLKHRWQTFSQKFSWCNKKNQHTQPDKKSSLPTMKKSPQIQGAFNLITLSKFPLKKTPLIDEVKKNSETHVSINNAMHQWPHNNIPPLKTTKATKWQRGWPSSTPNSLPYYDVSEK